MTAFNPEHIMQSVIHNLANLRVAVPPQTHAAVNLVGNVFALLTEINNNLNRIAVAQEAQVNLMTMDLQAEVDDAVASRTEVRVKEELKKRTERSFIGKKPIDT